MLRRLFRLLLILTLLALAGWAASRFLNREEDFDDYEDIDSTLDFTETPVEIDIPYEAGSVPSTASSAGNMDSGQSTGAAPKPETATATLAAEQTGSGDKETEASQATTAEADGSVLPVKGIGPTYAARLKEIGISTMSDLAGANADEVASKIEVLGGRNEVADWIKQAQELTSGGAPTGSQAGE